MLKIISLSIEFNQIMALAIFAVVLLILGVAIAMFVMGLIDRNRRSKLLLPEIEVEETIEETVVEEDTSSFFTLDDLDDDDYEEDLASQRIMQAVKKAQAQNNKSVNPFKRKK